MMGMKPYIVQIIIPTQCTGLEYKLTAIVSAGERKSAVKKFIFYINRELHKMNCNIGINTKLHHPSDIHDERERLSIYVPEDNSFRIITKELSRHQDFINITDLVGM